MKHQDDASKESARNLEIGYVQSRNMQVTICALGSTIFTYRMGAYIAGVVFPNSEAAALFFPNIFVLFGFLAVDFAFLNALVGASAAGNESYRKRLMKTAIGFFIATLLMSVVSNFFIAGEVKGESHLNTYNKEIIAASVRDSTLKAKAFKSEEAAIGQQQQMKRDAIKEGKAIIAAAVATGSDSWQKDYRGSIKNKSGWFWTCKRGAHCPKAYIDYRNRIIAAEIEAEALKSNANGYVQNVQASLAPTLSYKISEDSTYVQLAANVAILEKERNAKGFIVTLGLGALALFCGIMALQNTSLLAEHRSIYGQQVKEDNVKALVVLKDVAARIPTFILEVLQSAPIALWDLLKEKGWVKSYTLATQIDYRQGEKIVTQATRRQTTQGNKSVDTQATQDDATQATHLCTQESTEDATQATQGDKSVGTQATQDDTTQATQKNATQLTQDNDLCKNGKCKTIEHMKDNGTIVYYTKGKVRSNVKTYMERLEKTKKQNKPYSSIEDTLKYWEGKLAEFDK